MYRSLGLITAAGLLTAACSGAGSNGDFAGASPAEATGETRGVEAAATHAATVEAFDSQLSRTGVGCLDGTGFDVSPHEGRDPAVLLPQSAEGDVWILYSPGGQRLAFKFNDKTGLFTPVDTYYRRALGAYPCKIALDKVHSE